MKTTGEPEVSLQSVMPGTKLHLKIIYAFLMLWSVASPTGSYKVMYRNKEETDNLLEIPELLVKVGKLSPVVLNWAKLNVCSFWKIRFSLDFQAMWDSSNQQCEKSVLLPPPSAKLRCSDWAVLPIPYKWSNVNPCGENILGIRMNVHS